MSQYPLLFVDSICILFCDDELYILVFCSVWVHDNSSKDTSSNTTISLQRQLVYYDSLSNATLSLLLFFTYDIGRKKIEV